MQKSKVLSVMLLFSVIIILGMGVFSCDYNYGLKNEDYDIVITNYDPSYNFRNISKFTISDSIVNINDTTKFLKDPAKTAFINALKNNMTNRGFIYVPPSDTTADVIFVNAFTTQTYGGYYYPDYDPWFPWGYYDWYYPGYFTDYYEFSTGTVFIHLAAKTGTPKKLKVEWTAIGNGILPDESNYSRLTDIINKAFYQSPYLSK